MSQYNKAKIFTSQENLNNSIGENGDLLFNSDNGEVLFKKNKWKYLGDLKGHKLIKGPTGPEGAKGKKGSRGEQGDSGKSIKGPNGPTGYPGPTGPFGPTGTFAVFESQNNVLSNFAIPNQVVDGSYLPTTSDSVKFQLGNVQDQYLSLQPNGLEVYVKTDLNVALVFNFNLEANVLDIIDGPKISVYQRDTSSGKITLLKPTYTHDRTTKSIPVNLQVAVPTPYNPNAVYFISNQSAFGITVSNGGAELVYIGI